MSQRSRTVFFFRFLFQVGHTLRTNEVELHLFISAIFLLFMHSLEAEKSIFVLQFTRACAFVLNCSFHNKIIYDLLFSLAFTQKSSCFKNSLSLSLSPVQLPAFLVWWLAFTRTLVLPITLLESHLLQQ